MVQSINIWKIPNEEDSVSPYQQFGQQLLLKETNLIQSKEPAPSPSTVEKITK